MFDDKRSKHSHKLVRKMHENNFKIKSSNTKNYKDLKPLSSENCKCISCTLPQKNISYGSGFFNFLL